jgi:low affinity Fe/Cu permease
MELCRAGVRSFAAEYRQALAKDEPQMSTRKNAGGARNNNHAFSLFNAMANRASQAAGRAPTFVIAVGIVIIWAITGPLFQYSNTWQLIINTGTTIVTFLMVFLIQNSQNRDGAAIQVKLDELIRVSRAQNSFVGIEHLTDDELEEIRLTCERRAEAEKTGEALTKRTRMKAKHGSRSRHPLKLDPRTAEQDARIKSAQDHDEG